jgi:hypothetical protein
VGTVVTLATVEFRYAVMVILAIEAAKFITLVSTAIMSFIYTHVIELVIRS